jgi:uncharacterized protein (TIGR00369 family)
MTFDVPDPDFEPRIRRSFSRQGFNERVGAILGRVSAGYVEIEVPFSAWVTQQHGLFHGGVMGVIGDSACGYAAMTLTPPNSEVLTIEYKINFLSPAQGERLVARGRVTKPGRTVTVCHGDVVAVSAGREKLVATMLVTMMTVGGQYNASRPPMTTIRYRARASGVATVVPLSATARHRARAARRPRAIAGLPTSSRLKS